MRQFIEIPTSDGTTRLAADVRETPGPNTGTVILLHGFCLDRHSWEPQSTRLQHLFPGMRVVTYDHRGHGDSGESDPSTYTIETLAEDLAAVIAFTAQGPVTVIGHSMGGMTALAYHALPPSRRSKSIDALGLVATTAGDLAGHGLGRLLHIPGVDQVTRLAAAIPHTLLDVASSRLTSPVLHGAMKLGLGYRVEPSEADETATCWAVNTTPVLTKIGFLPALKHFDVRTVLPEITERTLVISGGGDQLTPPVHSDHLARSIPGARHVHFPESGHLVHHEHPDGVTAALASLVHTEIDAAVPAIV